MYRVWYSSVNVSPSRPTAADHELGFVRPVGCVFHIHERGRVVPFIGARQTKTPTGTAGYNPPAAAYNSKKKILPKRE